VRVTVDASRAKAKMRALIEAGPASRRAAVVEMTRLIMVKVMATAPRDTNRYVRGWAQAANSAGIGSFPVPRVIPATHRDAILTALSEQRDFWQFLVDRYERQGRKDRQQALAQRRLDQAQKQLEKFWEAQQSGGGAVVAINLRINAKGQTYSPYRTGGRNIRVIHKIYGGSGRIINLGEGAGTVVHLHNREAHASIVESNQRILGRAYASFRGTGLMKVKAAYLSKALEAVKKVA
jgi:hypothetical protein